MAYKYFFKTLDAQADRLLQSADVSPGLKYIESYSYQLRSASRQKLGRFTHRAGHDTATCE